MGDVTGKSASQTTAACILGNADSSLLRLFCVGTGLGVVISAVVGAESVMGMLMAFLPFSMLSIYANYRSARVVQSKSLNLPRAELIMFNWLKYNRISSAAEIAKEEAFIGKATSPFKIPIFINPQLHQPNNHSERIYQNVLFSVYGYSICTIDDCTKIGLFTRRSLAPQHVLRAFHHACVLRATIENNRMEKTPELTSSLILNAEKQANSDWPHFKHSLCDQGWEMHHEFIRRNRDEGVQTITIR